MKEKDDQFNNLSEAMNKLTLNVDNLNNKVDADGQKLKDLLDRVQNLENNDCHQDSEIDWLKKQVNKLMEKPTIDPTSSDFDISQIINLIDEKVGEVNTKFDIKFTDLENNLEEHYVKKSEYNNFKTKIETKMTDHDNKF